MLYAIITEDIPNSLSKRLESRAEHRSRLQDLSDSAQLVMAGPFPAVDSNDPGDAGFTGSLIVAEFPSLEDAQAWANDDPYVTNGVYASVTVKPFFKAF
ncbi:MAG: YciI family protein [Pseudomonadales bacterium]